MNHSVRVDARSCDQLRPLEIIPHYNKNALGSCLIKIGETHVLCTASVEEKVPPFLRGTGAGWLSAEYGMLPCATNTRSEREAVKGKQNSRTIEIQRLIGRSLRAVLDLKVLGEMMIKIDCDVISADGGTRTAAINGGYVALVLALRRLGMARAVQNSVSAISVGMVKHQLLVDLNYSEDSAAILDANVVIAGNDGIIEVQCSAERHPITVTAFYELVNMAIQATQTIRALQQKILS